MTPNFNTYRDTNTRRVSSWLHEIPSDAGGGSEATLIAPSVYAESAPRVQKDDPQPVQPRTPGRAAIKNPGPTSKHDPSPIPVNKNFNPALGSTPARLPIRPGPNPTSPTTSPSRPQRPPILALRETITQNFASHCLYCHPPGATTTNDTPSNGGRNPGSKPNDNESKPPCPRCALASAYTHRSHHTQHFLSSHLLPISQTFSFDETTAYLNQAIVARLAGVLARGGRGDQKRGVGRTWPTLDDFNFVRGVAEERRLVLGAFGGGAGGEGEGGGAGWGLGLDGFGMVRDRERERG